MKETKEDKIMDKIQRIVLKWELAGSSKFALKKIEKCLRNEKAGKELVE